MNFKSYSESNSESKSEPESKFNYSNTQMHQAGGKKTVRKVIIKNGKGHKSVKYYKNGKLSTTVKRGLKPVELILIKAGKFIPGLFKDCGCKKKLNKTKKQR
jgi:hypothetical protein